VPAPLPKFTSLVSTVADGAHGDEIELDVIVTAILEASGPIRVVIDMDDSILRRGVLATLSSLQCDLIVTTRAADSLIGEFDLLIVSAGDSDRAPNASLVITDSTPADILVAAVVAATHHPLRERHTQDLSPREVEILRMVARGLSNTDIAEQCFVAPNTVKTHLSRIYKKLGVNDRASAVYRAISSGIIPATAQPRSRF
jgi:DNA-binding CsgD family transcriptional regulator